MSFEETQQVPDKGPWSAETTADGRIVISSDDFNHDVQLQVTGDFGGSDKKRAYAQYLANILTAGCRHQHALNDLQDEGKMLHKLQEASQGPHGALLQEAAQELARLRVAVAEADKALEQLEAARYMRLKIKDAAQPSSFAELLQKALKPQ